MSGHVIEGSTCCIEDGLLCCFMHHAQSLRDTLTSRTCLLAPASQFTYSAGRL